MLNRCRNDAEALPERCRRHLGHLDPFQTL